MRTQAPSRFIVTERDVLEASDILKSTPTTRPPEKVEPVHEISDEQIKEPIVEKNLVPVIPTVQPVVPTSTVPPAPITSTINDDWIKYSALVLLGVIISIVAITAIKTRTNV